MLWLIFKFVDIFLFSFVVCLSLLTLVVIWMQCLSMLQLETYLHMNVLGTPISNMRL